MKFSKTHLSKLVQLGRVIPDIPVFEKILSSEAKKKNRYSENFGNNFVDKQIDRFNKE